MSYKVTKPCLVLFYILACFTCIVAYWGPFLCIVNFSCCVFCLLVVLVAENCFVPDCSGVVTARAFVTVNLLIEHFESK